ncbi:MAG: flavin reductase family protein [archaeon]|jgi:flavin reductase (DIM6/NTAB) family NADH-FMN oxidoreductase RutF|nr:flavin reductase family protein [archaeon]
MKEIDPALVTRHLYPRLTILVSTINKDGKVNAAPYSWIAPVSFVPPMLYVGIQARETFTVKNIRETKEFVVNVVTKDWAQEAVNCEAKTEDKVEKSGVKFRESKIVKAPTAKQAKIVFECKLNQVLKVEKADHFLIIGEIVHAQLDENLKMDEIAMHIGGKKFISPGTEFLLERKK